MGLEFEICQTKWWNQYFSFQLTKMDSWTITQRIKIIKTYYKNFYIIVQYASIWKNCEEMWIDWNGYKYWKACASSVFSFRWKYRYCKWKFCRGPECFNSSSFLLGLSYGTLCRILHLDLHLLPYKVQLMQKLKPAGHSQIRGMGAWTKGGGR